MIFPTLGAVLVYMSPLFPNASLQKMPNFPTKEILKTTYPTQAGQKA
jgi:hypothetical protein